LQAGPSHLHYPEQHDRFLSPPPPRAPSPPRTREALSRQTSADNPFRRTSLANTGPLEDLLPGGRPEDTMKALLVGRGEGPGGDILLQLEAAISRGDHRYAATLAKELAKLKISSRLTEQEDRRAPTVTAVKTIK
jgi:hypothetical protein